MSRGPLCHTITQNTLWRQGCKQDSVGSFEIQKPSDLLFALRTSPLPIHLCHKESYFRGHCAEERCFNPSYTQGSHKYIFCWEATRKAIMLPLFFTGKKKDSFLFLCKRVVKTLIFFLALKVIFFIPLNCSLRFQNQICLLAKYLCNMYISHWLIIIGFLMGFSHPGICFVMIL